MPNPGESLKAYIARYMASDEAKKDIPDEKQRLAVAYSEWNKKHLSKAKNLSIAKYYDDEQLVFGWASVAKDVAGTRPLDWQGDYINAEDLEPAVYKFNLEYRETNEMHAGAAKGELVESVMLTKEKMAAMGIPEGIVPEGWWVGFKIDDPEAYQKVKKGIYKMFSIEGSGQRVPVSDEEVKNYANIT